MPERKQAKKTGAGNHRNGVVAPYQIVVDTRLGAVEQHLRAVTCVALGDEHKGDGKGVDNNDGTVFHHSGQPG